jgi:hypothetical protein
MQYVQKMQANSRDRLGEQMQIHEITQKLNEVSPGGVIAKSFLSGLAGGATSALSKVGITGPDASAYAEPTTGGANDPAGAQKATASLVASMVPAVTKAWGQTVAKYMAQSKDPVTDAPVTSVDRLDNASKQMLRKELYAMINNSIAPQSGNYNYETLGNSLTDLDAQEQADIIKTAISKNAEAIWNSTITNAKGNAVTNLWTSLVKDGIAPASSFLRFNSQNEVQADLQVDPTTKQLQIKLPGKSAWEKFDYDNPTHVKIGKDKGFIK